MQNIGGTETKRHGLSYAAKKVQKVVHDVIEQLDIAMYALRDIADNGKGKKKAAEALTKIKAIDSSAWDRETSQAKEQPSRESAE